VTDDGRFQVLAADTWTLTGNTWNANPSGESGYITELGLEQEWLDTYTGIVCRGRTALDEQIAASVFDTDAEQNIFSNRFRPWPMHETQTIEYPVTRAWLNVVTQGTAYERLTPRFPVSWRGELAHTVQRRDSVYILNTSVGLSGSAPLVGVLALRHTFDARRAPFWETELVGQEL
jgi:hypothetical protein